MGCSWPATPARRAVLHAAARRAPVAAREPAAAARILRQCWSGFGERRGVADSAHRDSCTRASHAATAWRQSTARSTRFRWRNSGRVAASATVRGAPADGDVRAPCQLLFFAALAQATFSATTPRTSQLTKSGVSSMFLCCCARADNGVWFWDLSCFSARVDTAPHRPSSLRSMNSATNGGWGACLGNGREGIHLRRASAHCDILLRSGAGPTFCAHRCGRCSLEIDANGSRKTAKGRCTATNVHQKSNIAQHRCTALSSLFSEVAVSDRPR